MPREDVPAEARWLVAALTCFSTVAFGDFVREWMHLPYQMRKLCSHSGAIPAQTDSDPVHYICPREGLRYFDPTNWVYAQALQLLCPELMAEVNWNLVTKGDICESILGMDFVWTPCSAFHPEIGISFGSHLADVASLVDAFVYVVYRLLRKVDDQYGQELLSWSASVARWRVDKAPVQFVAVDREVNLQIFDVWPRIKQGLLRQAL